MIATMEFLKLSQTNNFKKALIICLIVIFSFIMFVPFDFANRGDFEFHYEKSANLQTRVYAPLVHNLGSWFAYSENNFLLYVVLIVGFITPLLLWYITRHWQTVFFYFSTQYFWFMLMSPSQAFAGIFLIVLLATKNNFIRFLALVGASVSHGQGANLFVVSWIIVLFFEHFQDIKTFSKKALPACGSLFGKATPEVFEQHIAGSLQFGVTVATVLNFFVKIMPLPFLIPAILELWKRKHFAPIALALLGIVGAIFAMDRTLFIVPLVLLPYAGAYCAKAQTKTRVVLYLMSLALLGLQIFSWIRVKTVCVT